MVRLNVCNTSAGVCSIFGLQIEHLLRREVGNSLNSGCVSALAAPGLCLFNADYPAGAELHDPRCQIGLLELVEIGNTDADGLTEFVDRISEEWRRPRFIGLLRATSDRRGI